MWLFLGFVIPELSTFTAEVLESVLPDLPVLVLVMALT